MLSGSDEAMVEASDGSLTTAQITALKTFADLLLPPLVVNSDEFQLGIPATVADSWEDIVDTLGRETPSSVTSRRIRQYLIG